MKCKISLLVISFQDASGNKEKYWMQKNIHNVTYNYLFVMKEIIQVTVALVYDESQMLEQIYY